jgi:uncharacterized protein with HEPN domain
MSRDIVTLADIYIALVRIQEFVAGMTREEFLGDRKTQSAVLHQMMIIGEATKRLSAEFRQAHAKVNWKEYAGLRDLLIHQYDDVNLQWVWDMVVEEFPQFFVRVAQILPYPPI